MLAVRLDARQLLAALAFLDVEGAGRRGGEVRAGLAALTAFQLLAGVAVLAARPDARQLLAALACLDVVGLDAPGLAWVRVANRSYREPVAQKAQKKRSRWQ